MTAVQKADVTAFFRSFDKPNRPRAVVVKSHMLMTLRRTLVAFCWSHHSRSLRARRTTQPIHSGWSQHSTFTIGSIVGEIGAGHGELTVALAREVGARWSYLYE